MSQQYTIERLGHQGDGIAEGPVYAPRTLPGEVVSGVLDGSQLTDIRISEPSDSRVKPICRHYKSCGGCQLQHASDSFVSAWKTDLARKALAAHGIEAAFRPIATSPPRSRRRAVLAARRTKSGAMCGFHGRASGVITEIPDCQLLSPEIMEGLSVAPALAALGGSRKGVLAVTLTASENGLDVAVSGGKPADGALELKLAQLADGHGLARLAWEGEVIATRMPPYQSFGAARVVPPPGAFLQATAHGEATLSNAVKEAVAGANRVADLFAGCGTFSLPMAEQAQVHAVEGEASMIRALDQGWRGTQGLKRVTAEARDLFRRPLLPDELNRFDAVVLDPPRAGAEAQAAEVARSKVEKLAYVSCNPVSFARDAAVLVGAGFALDWVQVVDQFRWSVHTELAACFSRFRT